MPRRKKVEKPTDERKKIIRRNRNLERKRRKSLSDTSVSPNEEVRYWGWLNTRAMATRILNNYRERPYWASIAGSRTSNPPLVEFFPVTIVWQEGRFYFGFLVREHRDLFCLNTRGARRELTGCLD